jgi:hypothetical protein
MLCLTKPEDAGMTDVVNNKAHHRFELSMATSPRPITSFRVT